AAVGACRQLWAAGAGGLVLGALPAEVAEAPVVATPVSEAEGEVPVDGSRLDPPASALRHRHAEPCRLREPILESPRSGLTQVFARTGQVHCYWRLFSASLGAGT